MIPRPGGEDSIKKQMLIAMIDFTNKILMVKGKQKIEEYKINILMEALTALGFTQEDTENLREKLEKTIENWLLQEKQKREEHKVRKRRKHRRREKTRRAPNEKDILAIKRKLKGLVISERDKNAAKLYCE